MSQFTHQKENLDSKIQALVNTAERLKKEAEMVIQREVNQKFEYKSESISGGSSSAPSSSEEDDSVNSISEGSFELQIQKLTKSSMKVGKHKTGIILPQTNLTERKVNVQFAK